MPERQRPPRVVVVVSHLGFGGAERQTIELLRQLRDTRWAPVRVICLSAHVNPYGATVRELDYPLSVVHRTGGFDLRRCHELRRLLRENNAEVVHAVNWFATAYSLVAAPRGALVVSSVRNSRMPSGRIRRFLLRRLLRHSPVVIVNSERGRQLVLHECRVPIDRVALVPNGIDVERVRQAGIPGACRHELRIPDNAPLVAYVGRNARVKNIPRLLAVTRRLLHQSPGLHVVIAGEGLDRRIVACTDLAHDPRVHCIGTRQDIPSLLRDANLLILTSDSEGTPNVILEALAVCVPVVATAVGDLPKVVPQTCGALVAPDSDQLASAALRVLSSGSSLRGALQLQAEHISNAYSLQAMVNRTTAVWTRVMDSSGSAFDQPDVPLAHTSDHIEKRND